MWFEDGTDLFWSLSKLAYGQIAHDYSFKGLDQIQALAVREFAVLRFKQQALDNRALLVVVDETGSTEDYDWLRIVGERSLLLPILPEVIGFDQRVMTSLGSEALFQSRSNYELEFCILSIAAGGRSF